MLVPTFLEQEPVEWMDGMGLRYVRRPDDEYDLWSVGPDGVDNGGKRDDTLWYR